MYLYETIKGAETRFSRFLLVIAILLLNYFFAYFTIAEAADTINVIAKHPQAEASSIYQINFQVSRPISPKATIRVKFPAEFDLSHLMVAGSNTINGGFDVKVEDHTVILKRSGLGREIRPNEKVDVKFAIVKNPAKYDATYTIEVEIINDKKETIIKKQDAVKILPKKK